MAKKNITNIFHCHFVVLYPKVCLIFNSLVVELLDRSSDENRVNALENEEISMKNENENDQNDNVDADIDEIEVEENIENVPSNENRQII
jgi:hypothetical protein